MLTIHRSKGLEFPIVYIPYLWTKAPDDKGRKPVSFHTDDGEHMIDVSLEGSSYERNKHRWLEEQLGEDLRLAYVALTRAKHQAITWWVPGFRAADSARLGDSSSAAGLTGRSCCATSRCRVTTRPGGSLRRRLKRPRGFPSSRPSSRRARPGSHSPAFRRCWPLRSSTAASTRCGAALRIARSSQGCGSLMWPASRAGTRGSRRPPARTMSRRSFIQSNRRREGATLRRWPGCPAAVTSGRWFTRCSRWRTSRPSSRRASASSRPLSPDGTHTPGARRAGARPGAGACRRTP